MDRGEAGNRRAIQDRVSGNHLSLQEAIFQPPKDSDMTFFIMTTRWRQIPRQGRKQAAYTPGFNLFLNPGGPTWLSVNSACSAQETDPSTGTSSPRQRQCVHQTLTRTPTSAPPSHSCQPARVLSPVTLLCPSFRSRTVAN